MLLYNIKLTYFQYHSCVPGPKSVSRWSKLLKIDKIELSRDDHVIGHFLKKSIIIRDTRDHQEHDALNRLSIPGPRSEEPVAEIHHLKTDHRRFIGYHWISEIVQQYTAMKFSSNYFAK